MAKRALIIANEEYADPRFLALFGAGADAEGLRAVLADPEIGGFDVRVLSNGRLTEVRTAIHEFFRSAVVEDTLVLHISAHGRRDLRQRLYFVAADTGFDSVEATGVSASYVNEQMSDSRSRRIVLLLDCCYSGAFTRGMRSRGVGSVDVAAPFDGYGRIVITASTALEVSHEAEVTSRDAAKPSYFSQAIIDGLRTGAADRDGDGQISANELYDYVYEQVRQAVPAQTPTLSVDRVRGQLILARVPARSGAAWRPAPASGDTLAVLRRLVVSESATTRQAALTFIETLAGETDPELAAAAALLLADHRETTSEPAAQAYDVGSASAELPVSDRVVVTGAVTYFGASTGVGMITGETKRLYLFRTPLTEEVPRSLTASQRVEFTEPAQQNELITLRSMPEGDALNVVFTRLAVPAPRPDIDHAQARDDLSPSASASAPVPAAVRPLPVDFDVTLRGYDRHQVEEFIRQADAWLAAPAVNPRPKAPPFTTVLRGYDRAQVDEFVQGITHLTGFTSGHDAAADRQP